MYCEHCGKDLQEDEKCVCRLSEEKVPLSPFPLWLIPGAICSVIALGYVALKIVGCNYFLWVHIVWLISAAVFFYLLMRKIKHNKRTIKIVGILLLTVSILAVAGRAFFNMERVIYYNNEYVFVSDIVDRYFLGVTYTGPLIYEYRNFIWYGPLCDRWGPSFYYNLD